MTGISGKIVVTLLATCAILVSCGEKSMPDDRASWGKRYLCNSHNAWIQLKFEENKVRMGSSVGEIYGTIQGNGHFDWGNYNAAMEKMHFQPPQGFYLFNKAQELIQLQGGHFDSNVCDLSSQK